MLKLGFIGYGFVGRAQHYAFRHNATAFIVDPEKNSNTIEQLCWTFVPKIIFVSLPAPTLEDGSVDISIIRDVLQELVRQQYEGIVVLKSTIPPEKIHDLYTEFANDPLMQKTGPLRFVYSPEFLREGNSEYDVLHPEFILLAGNWQDCQRVKETYQNHSNIETKPEYCFVDYRTASLIKYSINTFLAMKVTFMNQIYQYMNDVNGSVGQGDWEEFTDILSMDKRIGPSHMKVPGPDGKFGYGGSCFPKDMKAFIASDKNERLSVLREVAEANTKIRLTGKLPKDET